MKKYVPWEYLGSGHMLLQLVWSLSVLGKTELQMEYHVSSMTHKEDTEA